MLRIPREFPLAVFRENRIETPFTCSGSVLIGESPAENTLLWTLLVSAARDVGWEWSQAISSAQQTDGAFLIKCVPMPHQLSLFPVEFRAPGNLGMIIRNQSCFYSVETYPDMIGTDCTLEVIEDTQRRLLLDIFGDYARTWKFKRGGSSYDWASLAGDASDFFAVRHPRFEVVNVASLDLSDPKNIVAEAWRRSKRTERITEKTFAIAELGILELKRLLDEFELKVDELEDRFGSIFEEEN